MSAKTRGGGWCLAGIFLAYAFAVTALFTVGYGDSEAAVTTATHTAYALRPCSTCREVAYPTEAECRAAAQAEARRVGDTRTTGSAVFTCISRHNVIATFRANPPPSAVLSWTPPTRNVDGSALTTLAGYRVHYGRSPGELTQVLQVANPAARGASVTGLASGVWYFAVRAYTSDGSQSALTPVWTRTVP